METSSPYLKRLSLILKAGTTFNSQEQLNYPILLLVTLSCTALILGDFAGSAEHGFQDELLNGRIYEAIMFGLLIANIFTLIWKRSSMSELIQILLEPIDEGFFGTENTKIVKNFFRWINIIGTIFVFNNVFLVSFCMKVLGPLCTLPFYPANTAIQSLPLPVGRIPFHTDSVLVYAAFYINSSIVVLASSLFYSSWYLLLIFSTLKIKARLQTLVNTIETLDEQAAIRSMVLTEISRCSTHHISEEDMLAECTRDILGEALSEHVKIMR